MTNAQRNAIVSPQAGLMIWCNNCGTSGELQVYNGTSWTNTMGGTPSVPGIKIGTQLWAPKNLNVSTYRNGEPIPHVTDAAAWANLTTGAYCYYDNDSDTYAGIFGKLYNWYAVNDPRG
jgi:hypothetical protein